MADRDAIVGVALDYFEGWFDGDAGRMERTLDPDWRSDPRTTLARGELEKLTAREMIEATAKGIGKTRDVPDRGIEVESSTCIARSRLTVGAAVYVDTCTWCVRARDGRSSTPSGSTLERRVPPNLRAAALVPTATHRPRRIANLII